MAAEDFRAIFRRRTITCWTKAFPPATLGRHTRGVQRIDQLNHFMLNPIIAQRMTARMEGGFCVFLIGMRINRPLKIHKWFPVAQAMPRMLRELAGHKEYGFLGGHFWLGRTIISLQYWRSQAHLIEYATNKNLQHSPAWTAFTRSVGDSGDVGIWHETYVIGPGAYETIYHNMPPFGLGKVGALLSATGHYQNARDRLQQPKS